MIKLTTLCVFTLLLLVAINANGQDIKGKPIKVSQPEENVPDLTKSVAMDEEEKQIEDSISSSQEMDKDDDDDDRKVKKDDEKDVKKGGKKDEEKDKEEEEKQMRKEDDDDDDQKEAQNKEPKRDGRQGRRRQQQQQQQQPNSRPDPGNSMQGKRNRGQRSRLFGSPGEKVRVARDSIAQAIERQLTQLKQIEAALKGLEERLAQISVTQLAANERTKRDVVATNPFEQFGRQVGQDYKNNGSNIGQGFQSLGQDIVNQFTNAENGTKVFDTLISGITTGLAGVRENVNHLSGEVQGNLRSLFNLDARGQQNPKDSGVGHVFLSRFG